MSESLGLVSTLGRAVLGLNPLLTSKCLGPAVVSGRTNTVFMSMRSQNSALSFATHFSL